MFSACLVLPASNSNCTPRFFQKSAADDFFQSWGKPNKKWENLYSTPLKVNMESNNEGLEDGFPCETGDFQVPC